MTRTGLRAAFGAVAVIGMCATAPAAIAGASPTRPATAEAAGAAAAAPSSGKVTYPTLETATKRQSPMNATVKQLRYGGGVHGIGVTIGAPKVYLVFWGTQWGTATPGATTTFSGDPSGMAPRLQDLMKGIGTNGELWSGVNTQYCEGVSALSTSCPADAAHVGYPTGGAYAGIWYDNAAASPTTATDHQIAVEAVTAAGHFGNTTAASNRSAQYVIVSATGLHPGGFNTTGSNWCAWHDWNGDSTLAGGAASSPYGDIAFTNLPYLPDLGGSCGANYVNAGAAGALDGVSIVGGHEYAETITDQNPAGGWTDSSGYENADKCAWVGVGGTGGAQNVAFATGSFAMQATWDNSTSACTIAHAIVTDATVPDAPTIGIATAGNASATLTWTAPAGDGGSPITGYVVTPYVGATAQTPQTFTSTATTQTITGLTNGTTYTFKVAAKNAVGTGSQSAASNTATPVADAPGAPTIGTATAGNGSATLTWTAPAGDGGSPITGYVVTPYVGGTAQAPQTFTSTATTQTITGLTNGTTYTFTVAAKNAFATGAPSSPSSAVTPATVPDAPTIGTATAGNAQVDLTWTAPADDGGTPITGYVVTPAIGGTAQTPQTFTSTATTQTITGLTNEATYTFTVAATNAKGTGADSTPSGPMAVGAPAAPGFQSAQPGDAQAKVGWFAPADNGSTITGYVITPYLGSTPQAPQVFDASATKVFVTGLTNGSTYTFAVAATNANGTGPASVTNPVLVGTPSEPGFPNVVPGTTTARMSWLIPPGNGAPVQGYIVTPYIGAAAQTPIVFHSTSRFQVVTGLTPGVSYLFKVAAFNAIGTGTAADSRTIVEGSPEPPWFQAAAPGDHGATVKFTIPPANGAPIESYTVWPVQGSTVLAPQVFATPGATHLAVTGLTTGVTYSFRVAATNSIGTSPYATTNTVIVGRPTAPSFVGAQPRDGGAKVAWVAAVDNGSPITAYVITPYIGSTPQAPQTFTSTATSQIVTGLTNGVSYRFHVAAINGNGIGPDDHTWDAITAGTPTAVGWQSATAGDGSATVHWQPALANASPLTSYVITPYLGSTALSPQVFAPNATTQVVTGLTNGQAYRFVIVAVNAIGPGPAVSTNAIAIGTGP